NALIDQFRSSSRRNAWLEKHGETDASASLESPPDDDADLLRMLFVCCHESLAPELQCALALKTLCGFSIKEVAVRVFASEANVYKRLQRARTKLRDTASTLGALREGDNRRRVGAVRRVLYMLYSEGYLSSHQSFAIRAELCDEAIRLCTLLVQHPFGDEPESYALLALMHLNRARLPARKSVDFELMLLAEQDRSLWEQERVGEGLRWLSRSAQGDAFTRYHAEAGIAALHCLSPDLESTRWDEIARLYEMIEALEPSPMHRLNRALAVAESSTPEAGLSLLADVDFPEWLQGSYLLDATLADLNRRSGHQEAFARHRERALAGAPTNAIRAALTRRFESPRD
ncbi:MAG: DUF6596 domain-containing protein, partial [Myxococcota bacterium]